MALFMTISAFLCILITALVIVCYVLKARRILACNKSGIRYKEWEMWDDAIRCFQKAVDSDPNHALSRYNLGFVLYFGKKKAGAAIKEFEYAIAKDKKMAPAYYALGHALFHARGKPEEALVNLQTAVALDPSLAEAYNTMGLLEIKKENWKKATEHFRAAITANDTVASVHCNLSVALLYQGKNAEALTYAKKYAELNPASVLAHKNLGNIYGAFGMKDEAEREFLTLLSMNPDNWQVHFWLGCLRLQRSQYKKAVVSFNESIKLHGDYALAHYNLSLCYEQCNESNFAKKHIEKAIELNPALGENLI